MLNRAFISGFNYRLPFTVREAGWRHPYMGTHKIVEHTNPSGQKYVSRAGELAAYMEWLEKGLRPDENNVQKVCFDIKYGEHIVSIPVDFSILRSPLKELKGQETGFSLSGPCGLAVALFLLDCGYRTDILQERDPDGRVAGTGLRIAPTVFSLQSVIADDTKRELSYSHIRNWSHMFYIFTRLAVSEFRERLGDYKGVKGQIKLAREAGIVNLEEVKSQVDTMGFAEEMGFYSYNISLNEIQPFDVNFISGLIERARRHEIYIKSLINGIQGRPEKECEAVLDGLIQKKFAMAEARDRVKRLLKPHRGGPAKDSAEAYYYEKLHWCRENNIQVDDTLPDFQKLWEGETRNEWTIGFAIFKRQCRRRQKAA